jgi:hypothetical protein
MNDNTKIKLMVDTVTAQARKGNPLAMELRKAMRRHDHRDEVGVLVTAFNGMRNILEEYGGLLSIEMAKEANNEHPEVVIAEEPVSSVSAE